MHLYILTRGIKNNVDQFITELQGQYLPFRFKFPGTDKLQDAYAQVGVRPIQLWEVVFPEESKDLMLTTLLDANKGAPQHKKHKKFIWALRKALGVLPIPDFKTDKKLPIFRDAVEINAIGIKPDYFVNEKGEHLFNATEEEKKKCWEGL